MTTPCSVPRVNQRWVQKLNFNTLDVNVNTIYLICLVEQST